jgi:hypothetical protein
MCAIYKVSSCAASKNEGGKPMILHLVALLVLGLMCGSELNVALFSHPALKKQPLETPPSR